MLPFFLREVIPYTVLHYFLEGIYYSFIAIALIVGLRCVYRRLTETGYDRNSVKKFIVTMGVMLYPAIIISARAANMFYYPVSQWSLSFFWEQLVSGHVVTFHGGFFFPAVVIYFLSRRAGFNLVEVLDSIFLYIPIGHAIGRLGCLLVGCCWGHELHINLFGQDLAFDNPIPLFAIVLNCGLFLLLRLFHQKIYSSPRYRESFRGIIISFYLIMYGNIRLILEEFRTEPIIGGGLTQAQIVMLTFIILGSIIFTYRTVHYFIDSRADEWDAGAMKKSFSALMGFTLTYGAVLFVAHQLLVNQIIRWPFRTINNAADIYSALFDYTPVLFVAFLLLFWMRYAGLSVISHFRWRGLSPLFLVGLLATFVYGAYYLRLVRFGLDSMSLWGPVILLSILNALSEEIIFRVALLNILRSLRLNIHAAVVMQSIFYSLVHMYIGGFEFATLSIAYGILLGYMTVKSKSVISAVICHFIMDLAMIGLPVMSL